MLRVETDVEEKMKKSSIAGGGCLHDAAGVLNWALGTSSSSMLSQTLTPSQDPSTPTQTL
jgi:hypothetical protein